MYSLQILNITRMIPPSPQRYFTMMLYAAETIALLLTLDNKVVVLFEVAFIALLLC